MDRVRLGFLFNRKQLGYLVMEVRIDEEFQRLLMPLPPDAKRQLEENITADGCRDALVVWQGILIDGHNRYEICERLGINYDIVEIEFASREDAADWIDRNQEGRRNATPEQLSLIRGRRYNRAKKKVGRPEGNSDNLSQLSTAEQLAEQHNVDARTIKRDGKFAEAVEALGMESEVVTGEVDAPKAAIIEAAKPIIEANRAHAKWEAESQASPLIPPPEPPLPTVEDVQKAKAHVSHNSGENEWYTPADYIKAARAVMGKIDCDPASSDIANETVKAKLFYTKENSGLENKWRGNVWMNPPYAQPLISQFAEAIAVKFESSEIKQAIVLVNNATETVWFQKMAGVASAVCFPKGRIRFIDPQGNLGGSPLQRQAFLYFGSEASKFIENFSQFGFCGSMGMAGGLTALRAVIQSLEPYEAATVRDWILERLD